MRLRQRTAMMAVAALAVVGGVTAGAGPASAGAYGCNGWNFVKSVPTNNYCVSIDGTGRYVKSVSGSASVNVGSVCNYNITAEFFDTSGRWYMTRSTPVTYGCFWGTRFLGTIGLNQYVRPGKMCSTLRQNGARVTSVCHSIY